MFCPSIFLSFFFIPLGPHGPCQTLSLWVQVCDGGCWRTIEIRSLLSRDGTAAAQWDGQVSFAGVQMLLRSPQKRYVSRSDVCYFWAWNAPLFLPFLFLLESWGAPAPMGTMPWGMMKRQGRRNWVPDWPQEQSYASNLDHSLQKC